MAEKRRKWTPELFLQEARRIHGEKFEYNLEGFVNTKSRIGAFCKTHGVRFTPSVTDHIFKKSECPDCKKEAVRSAVKAKGICASLEAFKEAAVAVHGQAYDYSKVVLGNTGDPVEVVCPKEGHGSFYPSPGNHIYAGTRCPACAREDQDQKRRQLPNEFIADCSQVHNGKYDYSSCAYTHSHAFVDIICPKHGVFSQIAYDHKHGHGCLKCGALDSLPEEEIAKLVEAHGVSVTRNHIMECGLEIDVYCHSLKLGIEYNGLRWHSDEFRTTDYHLRKTLRAEQEGIRLIHVFEDEWLYKRSLCEAWILDKIGVHTERRYARNCEVTRIRWRDAAEFLLRNHMQGACAPGSVNLGLRCKRTGELVGVMCFSRREGSDEDSMSLDRFCTRGQVVGGFSKLLKHFLTSHSEGLRKVVSFADRRWSSGSVYSRHGFRLESASPPDYFWVKGQRRYVKERFRHCRLPKLFRNYDKDKSESENCIANGYRKLYDCGKLKWVLDL